LAVTDWRLRRWRVWFLALMTATQKDKQGQDTDISSFAKKKKKEFGLWRGEGQLGMDTFQLTNELLYLNHTNPS